MAEVSGLMNSVTSRMTGVRGPGGHGDQALFGPVFAGRADWTYDSDEHGTLPNAQPGSSEVSGDSRNEPAVDV